LKKRKKAPRVSSNKREVNILRGEKHFNFKFFYMIPFSPPPSHHFKRLFQIIEKIFLTHLDHPLAWQYTCLELYPFPLPMSSTYLAFRG
jgi:hypothetical protein